MSFKPKMIHFFALILAFGIVHSLIFLAHFSGFAPDISPAMFWLNATLLVLYAFAFLHLLRLHRHVYEISTRAVTEMQGIIYRDKKTVPIEKVYAYRINRSPLDVALGTASMTILTTGGVPIIGMDAVDYTDVRNAENLLDVLLLGRRAERPLGDNGPL